MYFQKKTPSIRERLMKINILFRVLIGFFFKFVVYTA